MADEILNAMEQANEAARRRAASNVAQQTRMMGMSPEMARSFAGRTSAMMSPDMTGIPSQLGANLAQIEAMKQREQADRMFRERANSILNPPGQAVNPVVSQGLPMLATLGGGLLGNYMGGRNQQPNAMGQYQNRINTYGPPTRGRA